MVNNHRCQMTPHVMSMIVCQIAIWTVTQVVYTNVHSSSTDFVETFICHYWVKGKIRVSKGGKHRAGEIGAALFDGGKKQQQISTHSLLMQFEYCYNKHLQKGKLLLNSIVFKEMHC